MEFNIKLSNGQILNGMVQSPGENTKAVIILVHGLENMFNDIYTGQDYLKKRALVFSG